ncbi:hypothetical protein BpHYR1_047230 [Brachionus plicatilis]|uniref:Uncharacterized protein n=1 Tax=Brachionus plicatilis TaxID=10195 RepID=A0A3M7T5C7_BRAPC|nr:hypothetical protein BpHYR1_047230 [Brachionus plicatilis]
MDEDKKLRYGECNWFYVKLLKKSKKKILNYTHPNTIQWAEISFKKATNFVVFVRFYFQFNLVTKVT